MTKLTAHLTAPMAVEVADGGWIIASGRTTRADYLDLFFDPAAADETGRRLREAARQEAGLELPTGHVTGIDLSTPSSMEVPADLRMIMSDGRMFTLTVAFAALVALARAAENALSEIEPAGRA